MKKKTALVFGTVLCAATFALGLAACDSNTEHTHTFGDWEVTKEATCLEEGSKKRACSECDFEETEKIDMLEHAWATDWQSDASGHWHLSTCEGHDPVKSAVAEHHFGDWVVTKPATHLTKGSHKKTCSDCKYELVEEIAELPEHTYAEGWTYDYTQHWHAATCGHSGEKSGVADHTPGSDGFCTVCGVHPAQLTTPNIADTGYTDGSAVEFTVGAQKTYFIKTTCAKAGVYTFVYDAEGVDPEYDINVKYSYTDLSGREVSQEFNLPGYDIATMDYTAYDFDITLYGATEVTVEISAANNEAADFTGTLSYEWGELSGNWLTLEEETTAKGLSMWTPVRYHFVAPKNGSYYMDFEPETVDVSLVRIRNGEEGDAETLDTATFSLDAGEIVVFELYQAGNDTQAAITLSLDHEHTPAAQWQSDGTYHWNTCTHTGCTAEFNKEEHDSTDSEVPCSVCGGKHIHTWSDMWQFDEEKGTHYHSSTCLSHDPVKKDEAPHDKLTAENNFTCVCGFVHNHTNNGVQSDETHHWYVSTCEDHEEVIYWSSWAGTTLGKAEHVWNEDGTCSCGYYKSTQNTVTGVTADNAVTKEIALTQDDSYNRIDFTVTVAGKYTLTYLGEKTIYIKYTYQLPGETYPENQTIMLPSEGSRTRTIDLSSITDSITVKFSVYAYIYSATDAVNGTLQFSFGEPASVTPEDPVEMTTAGATVNINGLNGGITVFLKEQDDATANGFVLGHTYKFTVNNNKAVFIDDRQTVAELEIVYSVGTATIGLTTTDGSALTGVTISVEDLGEVTVDVGTEITVGTAKNFTVGFDYEFYTVVIT